MNAAPGRERQTDRTPREKQLPEVWTPSTAIERGQSQRLVKIMEGVSLTGFPFRVG